MPAAVALLQPESTAEAIRDLSYYGEDGRVVAGATAVTVLLRQGLLRPAALVSLVGVERILVWLTPLMAVRLPHYPLPGPRRPRRAITISGPGLSGDEPVILGPTRLTEPGVGRPPPDLAPRLPERPVRAAQAQAWQRPEMSILGRATDGASFSPATRSNETPSTA